MPRLAAALARRGSLIGLYGDAAELPQVAVGAGKAGAAVEQDAAGGGVVDHGRVAAPRQRSGRRQRGPAAVRTVGVGVVAVTLRAGSADEEEGAVVRIPRDPSGGAAI